MWSYWERNNDLARQIACSLWKQELYYSIHKSEPLVTVISQMGLYNTHTFVTICIDIIFQPMCRSYEWFFSINFSTKTLYTFVTSAMHATCINHMTFLIVLNGNPYFDSCYLIPLGFKYSQQCSGNETFSLWG